MRPPSNSTLPTAVRCDVATEVQVLLRKPILSWIHLGKVRE